MNQITYAGNSNMQSSPESQKTMIQFTQAITTITFIGVRILRFLLLFVLLILASILWLWSISFQTGRLFGQWCYPEDSSKKPTELQITYKLGEIILFPFILLKDWSLATIEKVWDIKFPKLSESEPPQKCSELSLFKKIESNQ